jgi:hypothetical protein
MGVYMEPKISIDQKEGIILATRPDGERRIDLSRCMKKILSKTMESGIKKILLDFRECQTSNSPTELVNMVKSLPEDIFIASLTEDTNRENQTFIETASMNRGKMYRIFEDLEAALNWLKQN